MLLIVQLHSQTGSGMILAGAGCLTERNKHKAVRTQFARMFYPLSAMERGSLARSSLRRMPKAQQSEHASLRIGARSVGV